jgi:hypothetical protein
MATLKSTFLASFSLLLAFMLLELWRPAFVTAFFNITALATVVFISGILWILSQEKRD